MKLWIKTFSGDKLVTSDVSAEFSDGTMTCERLAFLMRETLSEKDIPTPNVITSNAVQLARFNVTRFRPEDFVERVDFDMMYVEVLRSDAEKRPHRRSPLDEA